MNKELNYSYSETNISFYINMKANYPPYFIEPLEEIHLSFNESRKYELPKVLDNEGDDIIITIPPMDYVYLNNNTRTIEISEIN